MMARAKASMTAGFVAVSLAVAAASAVPPARPFWKWISTVECRAAAINASVSSARRSSRKSDAGSQADSKP